jgi:DNA primase
MKPVPFAEFLARQQKASVAPVETPPIWPPKRKPAADDEQIRTSPLLRKAETQPPEARAAAHAHKLEQSLLKAFEDGRAAARRDLDEERARLKSEISEEVARARAEWAEQEGERLLEAHRAAFTAFEARCAEAVANILRPFLVQAAIGRVTESLVENLEVLFASRTQALFEISGPPDLLDALKAKFADRPAAIAFQPDDTIDVRVRVDDTIIETQLSAWMQALGALPPDEVKTSTQDNN